jgi:hypothetical protein
MVKTLGRVDCFCICLLKSDVYEGNCGYYECLR